MKLTLDELARAMAAAGIAHMIPAFSLEQLHKELVALDKKPKGVQEFIARYCELWSARYPSSPPINGKAAGVAKRVVKDLGLPRALELIESYLGMNEGFFVQRRHDLVTFESNLNAVATGKTVTRAQVRQTEERSGAQSQLERIRKGNL